MAMGSMGQMETWSETLVSQANQDAILGGTVGDGWKFVGAAGCSRQYSAAASDITCRKKQVTAQTTRDCAVGREADEADLR